MDSQQTSADPAASDDSQDQILPQVQTPVADAGSDAEEPHMMGAQTVPNERALVPLPEEAADLDLIEKEWVLKAKQIVEKTADDPFSQQEELSKMKAEYLKKRYKKDLA
jgi:hypothetical protein